jgi:hypothetical protein
MCFFIPSPGVAKSAAAEKAPLTPSVPQGRAGSNPAPDATLIRSLLPRLEGGAEAFRPSLTPTIEAPRPLSLRAESQSC